MEAITIFDLNAMYEFVNHKISGVWVNEASITWTEWVQHSEKYNVDHIIHYLLDSRSKTIHILFPDFVMM